MKRDDFMRYLRDQKKDIKTYEDYIDAQYEDLITEWEREFDSKSNKKPADT